MDVCRSGTDETDVLKVVNLLWGNKEDAALVDELGGRLVSLTLKPTARQTDDVEYYLPQLCHMVIHMKVAWESQALERFIFAISQTNTHIALQLSFYLRAAIEDYQPALGNDSPNPSSDPELFYRCCRLSQNVERAVVFGTPLGAEKLTGSALEDARRERANVILSANKANQLPHLIHDDNPAASVRQGYLLFKRNERKDLFHTKRWKERFFRIEQQTLFCLRTKESPYVIRAISLVGSTIVELGDQGKHPFTFEVRNSTKTMCFKLRTADQKTYDHWIKGLRAECGEINIQEPVQKQLNESTGGHVPEGPDSIDSHFDYMSSAQRKRAHFFRQQISFTDSLTSMADSLRPVDKAHRKHFLKAHLKELVVAPFCYVPMCSSLNAFSYVLRALPGECHAFTTKARVPALMIFEVEEHPRACDVRSFLESELPEYPDSELAVATRDVVPSGGDGASESADVGRDAVGSGASRLNSAITSASRAGASQPIVPGDTPVGETTKATIVSKSSSIPELYQDKLTRLRSETPFQHLPGWSLRGLIAKSNDDVRQEVFVMQLIAFYQRAFREAKLPLWMHTYTILSTSKSTGIIQLIPDAYSIDSIKKREDFPGNLRAYYEQLYGAPAADGTEPASLTAAIKAFVQSMAAYSVVCYLLQIKDRHNGNVMIDTQGHIVHIDFGFVFGLAPGKAFSMELRVPWKLNREMVAVMGGQKSPHYAEYVDLCVQAMSCARRVSDGAVAMMEILTYKSNFPAFRYNSNAIADFKTRLLPKVADKDLAKAVNGLLYTSFDNAGSDLYDQFQLATNGIAV